MSGIPDTALRRLRDQLGAALRPALPRLVANRYEPRGLLGRGGMGEVHRAVDRLLGREVAIKVLGAPGDIGLTERLRREARVLASMEHPGIVPVHDSGMLDDGRAFYVMRLVEGSRLDDFARGAATEGGSEPAATPGRGELLRIMLRIAETVAFAHGRGIIHRDLKPGNVMIGPFGEVLVLDWGVAKMMGAARGDGVVADGSPSRSARAGLPEDPITAAGTAVGTPGYMAPEQARGDSATDQRADIHALGVMLRELLAGDGHGEVPKPLASIVARATAADPGQRYGSVVAVADHVRRWLDGERVLAHRETTVEAVARFVRRHQAAILLLLTYALVRAWILVWRGI